jgi:hypothetical protein
MSTDLRPEPRIRRHPRAVPVAAVLLALLPLAPLAVSADLGYRLSLEYGFLADAWCWWLLVAAVLGALGGLPLLAAVRLLRRTVGVLPVIAIATVTSVVVMTATGLIGDHRHTEQLRAAATACTAARVDAFVQLRLPYTAGAPQGQGDGTCEDIFLVPGTPAQADARVAATLQGLGWVAEPGAGPHRYRRGGERLLVEDIAVLAEPPMVTVRMRLG